MATAAGLVGLGAADVGRDERVGARRRSCDADVEHRLLAAGRADRGQLVDPLGERHQRRQRLERPAVERDVEPGHDDHEPAVREPADDRHQPGPEELRLVDRDDVRPSGTAASIVLGEGTASDGKSSPACDARRSVPWRVSSAWLTTDQRRPAITARRTRRRSSSVLPANIGPQMTSTLPTSPIGDSIASHAKRLVSRADRAETTRGRAAERPPVADGQRAPAGLTDNAPVPCGVA